LTISLIEKIINSNHHSTPQGDEDMKKEIAMAITLLMLMSGMFGMINGSTGSEDTAGISSAPGNNVPLLTSHAPIRINSNADFTSANGVSSGSGTQADPYIIENYEINGTNYGYCIYIGNTTVHFIVRNCSLHDASGNSGTYFWNSGLYLYNVRGGILENNTASNNQIGIYLDSSSNNTITNNTASSNNWEGIFLFSSSTNRITNNTANWNTYNGIDVWSSSSNTITNNNASNNEGGIDLFSSSNNNTIRNNNASNNYDGVWLYDSSSNTITNNTANSNNNRGIELEWFSSSNTITNNTASNNRREGMYLNSSSTNNMIANNTANSNDGDGIYLNSSDRNTITNNNASSNSDNGIYLNSSSNNTITNNTASNNYDGIFLYYSNRNTISNNTASSNNQDGIHLARSTNNLISNNNIPSNRYVGIDLYNSCKNNTIAKNNLSNNWNGIDLYSSDNNTIKNNTVLSNYYEGINLDSSSNNTIANNTASSNNDYGICLGWSSSNNTITNNNASNNDYGICLSSSSSNTLINNTMVDDGLVIWGHLLEHWNTHSIDTSNTVNGKPVYYWKNQTNGTVPAGAGEVILANCSNLIVENQNVSNGSVGIELGFSTSCTIQNNTASNNEDGVRLWSSSSNTLTNNTVSSNNWYGIDLYSSISNIITNNTVNSNNYYGIFLGSSSSNTFTNNTVSSNKWYGICLYYSSSNTIANNTVNSNNYYGIYLYSSSSNTMTNNTANWNNYYGIVLSSSNSNTITNNSASNNYYGIYLYSSSNNTIANNTANWNNYYGIYLYSSSNNTISNNSLILNQTTFPEGISLSDSDYNSIINNIISSETGSEFAFDFRKDIEIEQYNYTGEDFTDYLANATWQEYVNTTGGEGFKYHIMGHSDTPDLDLGLFFDSNGDGVAQKSEFIEYCADADADEEVSVSNALNGTYILKVAGYDVTGNPGHFDREIINGSTGIYLKNSENQSLQENSISNMGCGILSENSGSEIRKSTFNSNYFGVYLRDSNSVIYNNNFINNTNQAYDTGNNSWNAPYPTGGNYWSDYNNGTDNYSGPEQNISGPDGIGDTPYTNILGGSGARDNYPLMEPTADLTPPDITINSPSGGTIFNTTTVTVSWDGSDALGIDHYEIRIDSGSWIGVGLNTTYTFTGLSDGSHNVYVRAVDNGSNENTDSVTFTVDTTPPAVISASPTGTGIPVTQNVVVIFNESMNASMTPTLIQTSGTVVTYTFAGWSSTSVANDTATWTHTVWEYNETIGLNVSGAQDLAGNAQMQYSWNFTTAADGTPPEHSNEFPAVGGYTTNATPTISVHVTDESGVNSSTIRLYIQGFSVYYDLSTIPGGYNVSYTHEAGFDDGDEVTCRIVAEDISGNVLDFTWSFTVDISAPSIVSVSPPDGAENLPLNTTISATFSEQMNKTSVEQAFSISPGVNGSFSWNGNTTIFTPASQLENITYTITINTGAKDLAGNSLANNYSWSFTAGTGIPPEHSNECPAVGGYTSDTTPTISGM